MREKFAFIAVLGANDEAEFANSASANSAYGHWLDRSAKGNVSIFVCEPKWNKEPMPNVRVYFFRLADAVAVSDRGQEVQEFIFEDIAKWAATN